MGPPGNRRRKKKITDRLAFGRDVYNFRCYFCHGYSGDGRTVAAEMLEPKPRNFTADPPLTAEKVTRTLRHGVPGTAMKPFDQTLSDDEISAVAAFVIDEFVMRKAPNTTYHTEANGWADHQPRYGLAFPFVLGEMDLDTPQIEMTDDQRRGRALYVDACITCHEPTASRFEFRAFPLSHMGQVIRDPVDHVSRASVYGMHDRPFEIAGLSAAEAKGKQIYDQNCAFCHALNGTGKNWIGAFLEPHPRNLTDPRQTSHLSDTRLRNVIREGLEGTSMPAWSAVLNEEEIDATIGYLRKAFLGPERRLQPQ